MPPQDCSPPLRFFREGGATPSTQAVATMSGGQHLARGRVQKVPKEVVPGPPVNDSSGATAAGSRSPRASCRGGCWGEEGQGEAGQPEETLPHRSHHQRPGTLLLAVGSPGGSKPEPVRAALGSLFRLQGESGRGPREEEQEGCCLLQAGRGGDPREGGRTRGPL